MEAPCLPIAHVAIALPLSAPGAAVLAVSVGMAFGARSPLWEWPYVDISLWTISTVGFFSFRLVFSLFAATAGSPREVFRRTCCFYALASFILPLTTIVWGASLANESGWEGMRAGLFIGTIFVFGIATGGIALFLAFGKPRSSIPEFDDPFARGALGK